MVQKGLIMLRAISDTTLNIDSDEYPTDDVPDGLLTDAELAEVRGVLPGALPGYVTAQPEGED
jgi:hypothetical protein